MTISLSNIDLFLLIFMRMSGAILFNPILGRQNVPVILRTGLSLICAFLVTSTLTGIRVVENGVVALIVASVFELAVGFGIGVIMDILFSVVLIAGEAIDNQIGFSMATFYDPHSGVNMPLLGNYFNVVFMLVFFASNAHLTFFVLLSDSCRAIPPGTVTLTGESARYIVLLGRDMLELGLRMAIPVLAVLLICDITVGLLMRAVPQLNIFTIEIQVKVIVALILVVISVPVLVSMSDQLTTFMLEKVTEFLRILVRT